MKTHYDNLQVAQRANPRVIRAAYKSLVQEWHPDKHTGDKEKAEHVLKIINRAYEVLSDPELRQQHHEWIKIQSKPETLLQRKQESDNNSSTQQAPSATHTNRTKKNNYSPLKDEKIAAPNSSVKPNTWIHVVVWIITLAVLWLFFKANS